MQTRARTQLLELISRCKDLCVTFGKNVESMQMLGMNTLTSAHLEEFDRLYDCNRKLQEGYDSLGYGELGVDFYTVFALEVMKEWKKLVISTVSLIVAEVGVRERMLNH